MLMDEKEYEKFVKELEMADKKAFSNGKWTQINGTKITIIERDPSLKGLDSRIMRVEDTYSGKKINIGCDDKWALIKLGWWIMKRGFRP